MQARAQGVPVSNESFANSWSRHLSLGQSCSLRLGSYDRDVMGVGKFMGTTSVVEDLVAIIEALGEWREKHVHQLNIQAGIDVGIEVKKRLKWKQGKEKLLYWDWLNVRSNAPRQGWTGRT
jgi:hypothetical protein